MMSLHIIAKCSQKWRWGQIPQVEKHCSRGRGQGREVNLGLKAGNPTTLAPVWKRHHEAFFPRAGTWASLFLSGLQFFHLYIGFDVCKSFAPSLII